MQTFGPTNSRTYSGFGTSETNIIAEVNDKDFYITAVEISAQVLLSDIALPFMVQLYANDISFTPHPYRDVVLCGNPVINGPNSEIKFNCPNSPIRISAGKKLAIGTFQSIPSSYAGMNYFSYNISGYYA